PKIEAFAQKTKELEGELARLEKDDPLAKRVAEINLQLVALQKEKQDPEDRKKQTDELTKQRDQANKQLQDKLNGKRTELKNLQRPGLPADVPGAYAVSDGKPAEVHIQIKGEPDNPGPP